MRISYNWLKDFLPDLKQTPEEVAELLTLHSFETYVSGRLAVDPAIKVVKITKVEKHPNADRLSLATVTDGATEITVVCGAPNLEVGQIVPYSPPGARVKDEEGGEFEVREATIRGQHSPGMLNSLRELGLHQKEHGGIWILPYDLPLGSSLNDHLADDVILDADITPNRAHDAMSHRGVANELAALLQIELKEPELADLPSKKIDWEIEIKEPLDSPRYLLAEVKGAKIDVSPMWLQVRLLAAGGKPKNNLVDITNYVMFEIGNPTHLFDAGSIPAKNITVRRAIGGEKILALDDIEYELTTDDLVIANQETPIAIAGVMGGSVSGIKDNTTDMQLEVANFRSYLIQETSRRLNLRSESSVRFSKNIHPSLVELAARRTTYLLQTLAQAQVVASADVYPNPGEPTVISFRPQQASKIAGMEIAADEAAQILRRLRCQVDDSSEIWQVTPPLDRLDLEAEHDLVEEVVRVIGFQNIDALQREMEAVPIPGEIYLRERLRDNLAALGLTESYNYSFEPAGYTKAAGVEDQPHLSVTNPPAPELANLRVSLLPGLLGNLTVNRQALQKKTSRREIGLFEIGHVYMPADEKETTSVPGVREAVHVAGAVVGSLVTAEALIQAVADALEVEEDAVRSTGTIQQLDPVVQKKIKYRLPVVIFELNLSELLLKAGEKKKLRVQIAETTAATDAIQFVPYSKYPSAIRDISLLVDTNLSVDKIQEIIERTGGELVADVDLFDEYEPDGSDKKGLAFHIEYRAFDRTLTDEEINQIQGSVILALEAEIEAEIR